MSDWLTQSEIDDLCMPLKQSAAQIRFMRGIGIKVFNKPNGAALVFRAHLEEATTPPQRAAKPIKHQPNSDALTLAFQRHP
ncbi:MAG: hypothetical protein PXX77_00365 [Gallionella sp.]|nr:hypothetical protein [Gallionella sp.]